MVPAQTFKVLSRDKKGVPEDKIGVPGEKTGASRKKKDPRGKKKVSATSGDGVPREKKLPRGFQKVPKTSDAGVLPEKKVPPTSEAGVPNSALVSESPLFLAPLLSLRSSYPVLVPSSPAHRHQQQQQRRPHPRRPAIRNPKNCG